MTFIIIGRLPERIVVVGAGMAGLVCALELMKQNTWYMPKRMIRMIPALSAQQGKIYFAGDHTSHFPG